MALRHIVFMRGREILLHELLVVNDINYYIMKQSSVIIYLVLLIIKFKYDKRFKKEKEVSYEGFFGRCS
ncbi:MAG: hypothetical protein QXG86_02760 [Candidatus Woesearchaeota archaeon]